VANAIATLYPVARSNFGPRSSIKFNAEDYGRKPVGESVPAVGWQY